VSVCEREGGGKIERESTREVGCRAQEREAGYVCARFVCFPKKTIGIRLEERKNKYLCTRRHCHALHCTAMHCIALQCTAKHLLIGLKF